MDGDLTTEARAAIVKHAAWCDDCREILATVAASVDVRQRDASAVPAAVPAPWLRRHGLAVSAAALVVAGLAAVLLRAPGRAGESSEWQDLTAAMGHTRLIDGRLSGQTVYIAPASPTRSASSDVSRPEPNFGLESLAGRWRDLADAEPTAAHLHLAGVAALALARSDDAVRLLVRAAATDGARAPVFADLSAAFAARAVSPVGQGDDWANALAAAEVARQRDASLAAAWFNCALALDGLGRRAEARQTWLDYTARFSVDDGWRAEALRRLNPAPR